MNYPTRDVGLKKFDAVEMMRKIRDKIDQETKGMNFEQLKKYYKKVLKKTDLKPVSSTH